MQVDHSSASSEFHFMSCLVKANTLVLGNIVLSLSSQLIVLVFTKQPSAERYLANVFCQYFCELLEHSSSTSKYISKSFRKSTKIHPWWSHVSKVASFYRSNHWIHSVKNVFLETCLQNSQEKAHVRDSILIKLHS